MNSLAESNVWGEILHSLKGRLNQQSLDTWFTPIKFESLDNSQHVIHLRAPNQVVKDWVVSNYSQQLDESLNEIRLAGYSVGWVIGTPVSRDLIESPGVSQQNIASDSSAASPATASEYRDTQARYSSTPHTEPSLSAKY